MIQSIPNNWTICKFDDILEIVSGRNQKQVVNPNGQYPIYGSGGKMGRSDNYLCLEGTTIIGRKGTINSPIYVNEKFWNVDTAFGLSPKHVDSKLLYYFCLAFNFKDLDKSTTIPSLAKTDLLQIEFPLPPLAEQQRIVAKIEELFSELDKGIETLKTAQQQLKVYRQAVLKYAFEGKLTNPDVKERELPEGWVENNVKQIADSIQYGYTESSSKEQVGPKFLRITDIQDNKVNWADVPYCIIKEEEKAKYLLQSGDLVFARTGATVGKSFLIRGAVPESVFASYLIRVRFPKHISDVYVWYFFQSPVYWKQIIDKSVGTGQPNVNGTRLGELEVVFPESIEEQLKIVQEIESRLSVCDKIEESIEQGLQQAEALRQSILKKAFEGKLVPQDPNDEPASVLLKRIKAERAAALPEKKSRTKQKI